MLGGGHVFCSAARRGPPCPSMAVRTPQGNCRARLLGAQLTAQGPRLGWPILGASLRDWRPVGTFGCALMGDQEALVATLSTSPLPASRQVQHVSVPGGSGGLQPPPRCPPHGAHGFPSMAAAHHAPQALTPQSMGSLHPKHTWGEVGPPFSQGGPSSLPSSPRTPPVQLSIPTMSPQHKRQEGLPRSLLPATPQIAWSRMCVQPSAAHG